jgi:D-alanyl-D-alanine carboxypeptidase
MTYYQMTQYLRFPTVFVVLVVCICISWICTEAAVTEEMKDGRPGRENNLEKTLEIDKKHLLGQFDPASDRNFRRVKAPYTRRNHLYLLGDVYDAFIKMRKAAKADGISLVIISATRNFDDQKNIWQSKWTGERLVGGENLAETVPDPVERARIILKYSAMPGTSRHHWGTDIDINSVDKAHFESGKGLRTYQWLVRNAGRFGFVQPYTPKGKDRPYGYEEEPWHWSYNPIAKVFTRQYLKRISYDDITGFDGSETASRIEVIKHYVLGINPDCLK